MGFTRIAAVLVAAASLLICQTKTDENSTFELASVKMRQPTPGMVSFRLSFTGHFAPHAKGNRYVDYNVTLQDLMLEAYDVKEYQLAGLPDWAKTPQGDHFDIEAKSAGEATPTPEQLVAMLRNLLLDRFQLQFHREMRPLAVYALVPAKGGPKMRLLSAEEEAALRVPAASGTTERAVSDAPPAKSQNTVPMLIGLLTTMVDRPVVDATGMSGTYEYANVDWRSFGAPKRGGAVDPEASVYGAVQELLGLKLEPRKDPVEVLVIDRAEKPSAN